MNPDTILQKLTQRIREEFEEAPGLTLTVAEAARFWGLDEMTCRQVLGRLRASGFLVKDGERRYHQVSQWAASTR
jgi:Fic family protein